MNDSDKCVISNNSKSDANDDSRHAHSVEELHDVHKHGRKKHTCIRLDITLCNDIVPYRRLTSVFCTFSMHGIYLQVKNLNLRTIRGKHKWFDSVKWLKEDRFPQVALHLVLNKDIGFIVFQSTVKVAIPVTSRIRRSLLSFFYYILEGYMQSVHQTWPFNLSLVILLCFSCCMFCSPIITVCTVWCVCII